MYTSLQLCFTYIGGLKNKHGAFLKIKQKASGCFTRQRGPLDAYWQIETECAQLWRDGPSHEPTSQVAALTVT